MLYRKQFTKEQAVQKIKQFCAYQERYHYEVKEKLYTYGIYKQEVEELLAHLIEEDYLNEERFAIQFAGGRFRMKQWGRIKIAYELKQKQVSAYCINKALKQIDEADYKKTLSKLAEKKWSSIEKEALNKFSKINKTTEYLLQKGYESALIKEEVTNLEKIKAQRK